MAIADLHEDILKTHILTKLDPQTLAAAGCTSSRLQSLCSDQTLWSHICTSTWPSTSHPLITSIISTHRSFFSDASSSPNHRLTTLSPPPITTNKLISAVDIKYNNQLIFSKVESTNTTPTDWFQTSPFRIDLLNHKETVSVSSPVKFSGDDVMTEIENNMTLSWIVIDPTRTRTGKGNRVRAVNLSSYKPVSVQRNWLTNDVELSFGNVLEKNDNDHVNCNIQVTCGVNEEGDLMVSGVSLTVLDIYGKCLSGKESMVILQGVLLGERRRGGGGTAERERYGEYMRRRRERNEKSERRERRMDMAFVAGGVAMLMAFWSFAMC